MVQKLTSGTEDRELRNQILDEAHSSKLSIHLGSSKIYQDLKTLFWWTKMKKKIAAYVVRCDNCSRVKAVHLKSVGLLQPLPIPCWKWEEISMDFIIGLPMTQQGHDSIWVIVDRLTKSAHFVLVYTKIWKKNCRDSKAPKIISSRYRLHEGRYQLIQTQHWN